MSKDNKKNFQTINLVDGQRRSICNIVTELNLLLNLLYWFDWATLRKILVTKPLKLQYFNFLPVKSRPILLYFVGYQNPTAKSSSLLKPPLRTRITLFFVHKKQQISS